MVADRESARRVQQKEVARIEAQIRRAEQSREAAVAQLGKEYVYGEYSGMPCKGCGAACKERYTSTTPKRNVQVCPRQADRMCTSTADGYSSAEWADRWWEEDKAATKKAAASAVKAAEERLQELRAALAKLQQ